MGIEEGHILTEVEVQFLRIALVVFECPGTMKVMGVLPARGNASIEILRKFCSGTRNLQAMQGLHPVEPPTTSAIFVRLPPPTSVSSIEDAQFYNRAEDKFHSLGATVLFNTDKIKAANLSKFYEK